MTVDTSVSADELQKAHAQKRVVKVCRERWYLIGGLGLVVGGTVFGTAVASQLEIKPYELKDGISLFALLFIMAQALERFMEPFTEFIPGQEKSADGDQKAERKRAVFIWGVTSSLAMLVSAYMGVFLLRTIGATAVPLWIDIAVTGLAVGAGTKPLHDLIQRIEAGKQG